MAAEIKNEKKAAQKLVEIEKKNYQSELERMRIDHEKQLARVRAIKNFKIGISNFFPSLLDNFGYFLFVAILSNLFGQSWIFESLLTCLFVIMIFRFFKNYVIPFTWR